MNKQTVRQIAKKEFKKANSYLISKKVADNLYKKIKSQKGKNILLYISMENEVNTKGLIQKLLRENYKIFVPFMQDISFKMVKYSLPLKKKKFNIYEPLNKNKTKIKIDIAVVPIIGIDKKFRRVGFGKGMYDRFFEKLNYKPKIIFTQLTPIIANCVVTDYFDVKADLFLSYKLVCERRKYVDRSFNSFRCVSHSRLLSCKKI